MEHTPASSRNEMQGADAAKQKKKNSFKSNQVFRLIVCVVFCGGGCVWRRFYSGCSQRKTSQEKDWDDSGAESVFLQCMTM